MVDGVVGGNSGSSSTSETLISKLDSSDPLYLHDPNSSNLTIIYVKLKGSENYTVWFNAMQLALQVKNRWDFIDKFCVKNTDNEVLTKQLEMCNSIVLSWILNYISEELYMGHVFSKLASDVWIELKEIHNKIDGV